MRQYEVKYYVDDEEMLRGEKPHSESHESELVEAESSAEAIDLVVDYLIEQATQDGAYSVERVGNKLNFTDIDGEIVEQYYNFWVDSPIKEARIAAGLSRAEMCKQFDIPARTLQDWEAGRRTPAVWAEKLIVEKLESMTR